MPKPKKPKKAKKKRSYRDACERDISNGNDSKFTCACRKRFKDIDEKYPKKSKAS